MGVNVRFALTTLFGAYFVVRCCFSMHYFEGFAPLVLVCELSMMAVATLLTFLWFGALGEAGKRLRGLFMPVIVVFGAWILWQSEGPERISAHLRFALRRDHYESTVIAWKEKSGKLDGAIAEGERLFFPWQREDAPAAVGEYGVIYEATGALESSADHFRKIFPLHQGWYYCVRQ